MEQNMMIAFLACAALIALTTLIHYEVLSALSTQLPDLRIPRRSKLLVVIFSATAAHAVEMLLYGLTLFGLVQFLSLGTLAGSAGFSFVNCLYFSAETYTSLGFGDLMPVGPLRLLAGAEALNGLLLIGWTASYTYIAMERFWSQRDDLL
jgi:hypothetical protein